MSILGSIGSWWSGFFNKKLWSSTRDGSPTASRELVSEDSALNYSAVWCATRLLCGTGASLPFPVFNVGSGEERTKDREHPVYRLLNIAPNPEQTAYNFRSVMWQWQVNWGNAYAEIEREGNDPEGKIVALWPIHPERVEVCRDENGNLFYKVRREKSREQDELEPWQMLHIPSIITADGLMGHGVIAHARESIGAGIAAEKYGAHWFGGAAVPRAVIEHSSRWDDEARAAFRKEWDEIYSGPEGHRVAILQGGAQMKTLSLSAEDSQFIETRYLGIEEIARWYGVPPHMLQHLLRATFNNIEHLGINFVQYSLIPWLRVWEQSIRQKLFTAVEQVEYFAEHNVDALLRGDHTARGTFYTTMTNAALMTRNECRKLENLDPVEGGDTFLVQGAMVPLDEEGRPESKFVGGAGSSTTQSNLSTPDPEPEPPDDNLDSASVSVIAAKLHRIISHDLTRFLTKESKAIANLAKKPRDFVRSLDEFYAEHRPLVTDEMVETFGALAACGIDTSVEAFVGLWIQEGKTIVLEASGTATSAELPSAIQNAVDSRTWTERPLRAVEGIRQCKPLVAISG
jgi:HK97 family phage portal protein